jgi:prepilin-type N-terminal cleavage/methylation domain-containing protein/prepilin-type processing-associated H-X9-DG protein
MTIYAETHNKKAFTLIELLVVIVIIALLFSILMPSLGRTRSRAVKIVCASNMRQYAIASACYLDDNDDFFPTKTKGWLYTKSSDTKDHPIGCRWHDMVMSYRSEFMAEHPKYKGVMWEYFSDIRPCPTFRRYAESRGCENPNHNSKIDINPQLSYSINGYLGSTEPGGALKVSEVRDISKVFFFAEENSWTIRPDHPEYPAKWLFAPLSTTALDDTVLLITPTPQAKDCFATYHGDSDLNSGSSNLAFIDGHVDSISVEEQLREKMHGKSRRRSSYSGSYKSRYEIDPAGNLSWAWASKTPPPGGWDKQ